MCPDGEVLAIVLRHVFTASSVQHLHAELYRTGTMTILGLHVTFVLVIFRCILLDVNVGCRMLAMAVQTLVYGNRILNSLCGGLAFQRVDVVVR